LVAVLAAAVLVLARTGLVAVRRCGFTPQAATDCAAHEIPSGKIAALDPVHAYSLAELVDIAEHNNPRTRVVWERATRNTITRYEDL
jgi:hypothetical protein